MLPAQCRFWPELAGIWWTLRYFLLSLVTFFFLSLGPTNRASTALLVGGPTQSEEWPCVLMIHHRFVREFAPSSK